MCMNKTKDIKGGRIAYAVLLRADDQLCSPWVTMYPVILAHLRNVSHRNTWIIGEQHTSLYGPGYHSLRTRACAREYRKEMRTWMRTRNSYLGPFDFVIAKVWVSEACEAEILADYCGSKMSDIRGYVSRKRIVLEVCDE